MQQNKDQILVEENQGIVEVRNQNPFRILELDICIYRREEVKNYHVNSIDAYGSWKEGQETKKYSAFRSIGFYEGKEQMIDPAKFCEETGIYEGEPHHALVWPEDTPEEAWRRKLEFTLKDIGTKAEIKFSARGPRVAFLGHSFTGLWDSSYYYFRELAKMGGFHAQVAYSYWGGTGITAYGGAALEKKERAEQGQKVLDANEYYDYICVAGNSDEALETYSGTVGAVDYRQRESMLTGAKTLYQKAAGKGAKLLLWVPHAYQYGFFQNMGMKPWREGKVGKVYQRDGKKYVLTLSHQEMSQENRRWYQDMVEKLGDKAEILPVGEAYDQVYFTYGEQVNPYLKPGAECGDCGHQNNIGNYIAACVLYEVIFKQSPEGLGVPVSHTWGMEGGKVTLQQAQQIQEAVAEMFREKDK